MIIGYILVAVTINLKGDVIGKSLDYFYKFFKKFNYKKHILKEIKKNLI